MEALRDCVEALSRVRVQGGRIGPDDLERAARAQRRAERALAPFGRLQPPLERDYLVTATWLRFLDDGEQEVYEVRASTEEEAKEKALALIADGAGKVLGGPSLLHAEPRLR